MLDDGIDASDAQAAACEHTITPLVTLPSSFQELLMALIHYARYE